MNNILWWKAAGIRALKTMAQTAAAMIGTGAVGIFDVDWIAVLSASLLAGIFSLLTSLGGLPEVEGMKVSDFEKAAKAEGIEILSEAEPPDGIGGDFMPRLKAPASTDKNWIHTSKGGFNSCILIKAKACIPNCVGYAWGRWREILGKAPALSRNNAEDWWSYKDGYKRGQEPKLGAVACWRKGRAGVSSDGCGHVAIVEAIEGNTITLSNSAYGGSRFYLTKFKKGKMSMGGAYVFQGFIYLPESAASPAPAEPSGSKTITYTVKSGDTLSAIAKKYGTTVKKIAADNDIDNVNLIFTGQKLKIKTKA